MVRKCQEHDREALIKYLGREAVYNTFLLADIAEFGFDKDFQTVYIDEVQGEIRGVYLRFYQNLLLYTNDKKINEPFLNKLLSGFTPQVIMGRMEEIQAVSEMLDGYTMNVKELYLLHSGAQLTDQKDDTLNSFRMQKAVQEDAEAVFEFLQSMPELKQLYTSRQMIEDRICKNSGVHYLIKENDKIIAHANSTAQSDYTVMIGGVATAPEYRGRSLAGQIVSRLSREILDSGRFPCLFTDRGTERNLYCRLGFTSVGKWAVLTRTVQQIPEKKKIEEMGEFRTHRRRMPSYIPIYNRLYEDIVQGVYEKGSLLPSENILSEKYGVSRNTLRQALTILNQDGYIYKKQGKGTYVLYDSRKKMRDKIYNFLVEDALEEIKDITLDYNFGLPTRIARKKLELGNGDEVLASNNVYWGEQGPIGQSFLQIPVKILRENGISPESEEKLKEFMNHSLYRLAVENEIMIQLMEADDQVVPYLNVEPGTMLLHFEQILFDNNHRPIARIKYYFCSGKYQILCKW